MDNLEELLTKIKHEEYLDLVAKENNNIDIYIDHIKKVFPTLTSLEKVALINFYTIAEIDVALDELIKDPKNTIFLIESELLKGRDVRTIKENYREEFDQVAGIINGKSITSIIGGSSRIKYMIKYMQYLESDKYKGNFSLNDGIKLITNNIAKDFKEYNKYFKTEVDEGINIFDVVTTIFDPQNGVELKYLEEIYNEVLKKDPIFSSFDYTKIFSNDLTLISKIKGAINDIPTRTLDDVLYFDFDLEQNNLNEMVKKEKAIKIADEIEKAYELNKDDEESLYYFFITISSYKIEDINDYLFEILETKDYYQKYSNIENLIPILDNMVEEIKQGKYVKHNEKLIEVLGEYEKFAELNSLEIFMKSNDNDFKRQLVIPILIKDISKLKEETNVEFDLSFETSKQIDGLCGYYSHDDQALFVNRTLIYSFEDPLDALIECENTFSHEIRHAEQHKDLEANPKFNYENLLMSIEMIIHERNRRYYASNYRDISFEQDARAQAYVYVMTYFKDYPEIQEKIRKDFSEKIDNMTSFVKQDKPIIGDEILYKSIFDIFISSTSLRFDEDRDQDLLDYYAKSIEKYPIISMVFDYDKQKTTMSLKPKEYFEELKKKFENEPDSKEKEDALRCIELIEYQMKVSEYFKKFIPEIIYSGDFKEEDFAQAEIGKDAESYEELKEQIENELGPAPRR